MLPCPLPFSLFSSPGLPQDHGHLEMLTAGHGSVPWSKAKGSHSCTVQVFTDADRYQDYLVIQREISQDEDMHNPLGHICVPKGQNRTQSSHPSPGTSGTRDAGSHTALRQGFHTLPTLPVCLQAGNPNHCCEVRKALSCPVPLGVQPSHLLGLHPAKHLSAHSSLSEVNGTTHTLNSETGFTKPMS